MNTVTYLLQIKKFDYMIQNKNLEIERLRTLACNMVAPTDHEQIKTSGTSDKIGNMGAKIADLSLEIDEIMNKRHMIVNQIEQIEDADLYNVLAHIYILGYRLEEIADLSDVSIDTIKRLKKKALKEFDDKFFVKETA